MNALLSHRAKGNRWKNQMPPVACKIASGFTLIESLAAVAVSAFAVGALYAGLTELNQSAAANRLYSCATVIVENRIDSSLSAGPFILSGTSNLIPAPLATGTTIQVVPVYTDPATLISGTGPALVSGTMTTIVTPQSVPSVSGTVTLYQTTVKLDYSFRHKPYEVKSVGMRASDS